MKKLTKSFTIFALHRATIVFAFLLVGLCPTTAQADSQHLIGSSSSLTNISGRVGFERLPDFAYYSALGINFSSNLVTLSGASFSGSQSIGNCLSLTWCGGPMDFMFSHQVKGVAFNAASNPGTSTILAFLSGELVSSFTADFGSHQDVFYGFDESVTLDMLRILPGGINNAAFIDNMDIGVGLTPFVESNVTLPAVILPVPEPETYAMLLAGLGLLGFMARRRKNNTV